MRLNIFSNNLLCLGGALAEMQGHPGPANMSTHPTLETARLRIHPYTEADISELLPLIGTREVAATTLRISYPYTQQDARKSAHPPPKQRWPRMIRSHRNSVV